MKFGLFPLLTVLWVFVFTEAAPIRTPQIINPDADPFYQPPSGYENAAPGTILKSREAPYNLRSVILPVQVKNTWQFLVRTNDVNGKPMATVSTIIEPYNSDPSKLVSFQVAEDASAKNCAPSFALTLGAPVVSTLVTQAEMLVMESFLNKGYFLVSSDYEGPNAAFTVGRLAAHGVLDCITAALNSKNVTGIDNDAKTAMFGYSGGSLASGWAASLQPDYAPHLNDTLVGVALGGFVPNISATTERIDGGFFSGLSTAGLNGITHAYPNIKEILMDQLDVEEHKEDFEWGDSKCLVPNIVRFIGRRFFSGEDRMFKDGFGLFDIPAVKEVVAQTTLATKDNPGIPQIPVYLFHSENDEVAPFRESQRVYDTWCKEGIKSFEFNADIFNEHITEYVTGASSAINWIDGIFAGNSTVQGCKKTTRFTNLEIPNAWSAFGELVKVAGDSFMQEPMGAIGAKVKMVVEETKKNT